MTEKTNKQYVDKVNTLKNIGISNNSLSRQTGMHLNTIRHTNPKKSSEKKLDKYIIETIEKLFKLIK